LCIKLVIKTSLYYDARSEKHRIMRTMLSLTHYILFPLLHKFRYIQESTNKCDQFSSRHFWVPRGHPSSRQDRSVKKYKSRAYEAVTVTYLCNTSSYFHLVVGLYCQSICIPLTRVVSRNTFGDPTPQLNAGFNTLGPNIKEIKFQNFFSITPRSQRHFSFY
jgi:hypothetical protein